MTPAPPVVECGSVSKTFRIPQRQHHTLRGRILHPLNRPTYNVFEALHDVTLQVGAGEFVGILGRNGSGKSTLLKIIAGIYRPTAGKVVTRGRIASFIELGVGFNPELSGRENIFINGALLGLTNREIRRKYDEIVEFAELEEFMEMKLRNFSSGMQVRLAFSIALQAPAEVLLTDEVLAVGDARFQARCYDVFRDRKRRGQTVIFVSHDMTAIQQFCDTAVLLEEGRIIAAGATQAMTRRYLQVNADVHRSTEEAFLESTGGGSIRLLDAWIEDSRGARRDTFDRGERFSYCVRLEALEAEERWALGMSIQDQLGQFMFLTNSEIVGTSMLPLQKDQVRTVRYELVNHLQNGSYDVGCAIAPVLEDGAVGPASDVHLRTCTVTSMAPSLSRGLLELPVRIDPDVDGADHSGPVSAGTYES